MDSVFDVSTMIQNETHFISLGVCFLVLSNEPIPRPQVIVLEISNPKRQYKIWIFASCVHVVNRVSLNLPVKKVVSIMTTGLQFLHPLMDAPNDINARFKCPSVSTSILVFEPRFCFLLSLY